jgi:hypothetical protein
VERSAAVGVEVVLPMLMAPEPICVVAAGAVVTPALVGANRTAAADPGLPQPYPCTKIPTSGQVARLAAVGAESVLDTVVRPTVPCVFEAGARLACPAVGAKITAAAEPGGPQP